ncbi:2-dehydropantoate 2-reductase [Christensenellaceae bacterium NSJ-63]|uniref:2-dehydropantoate 2-reductase n=1 Tax=Guopingia tenuis TaxID=2763656 RepID=A0A926DHJ2_9FIRM|nr:2-dehydropantoate 2-reductase [Guopingia tenuis]MBC8538913.1 2-dehydropantoate 2-reductase [Guopingia tenuis]
MKYLIVGTGGTGGAIGGYLAADGRDVSFIARGVNRTAMKEKGLFIHSKRRGELHIREPKVYTMEEWQGTADVIFVCVKWYSIGEAAEFLKKAAGPETLVIPILNITDAGEQLSRELPERKILDGVIYVSAFLSAPGEITENGAVFTIVAGPWRPEPQAIYEKLAELKGELEESRIQFEISKDIRSDAFEKFSMVSPFAAAGTYLHIAAEDYEKNPAHMQLFRALVGEVRDVALAMGLSMREDIVEKNVRLLTSCAPDSTASMQKDYEAGHASEVDGLVYQVVRLGRAYSVPTPNYEKIARALGFRE